jgi:hypothetical protein
MAFDVEDERRFMRLESSIESMVRRSEERDKREEEEKREAKKKEEEEKREKAKREEEEKREAKKKEEAKREEEKRKAAKKAKDHDEPDGDEGDDEEDEDEEARKERYARSDREEAQRREKAGEKDEDEETREARHAKEDEEEEAKRSVKMTSRSALNAEIVRLTMENASLRQNRNVVSIETRVESAIRRGVITKAQKRWALSNPRAFTTLESQFKSNTGEHFEPGTVTQTRGGAKRTVSDLTVTERHMCRQLNVTPEAYLKSLDEKPLGQTLVDANPDIPADKTAFGK